MSLITKQTTIKEFAEQVATIVSQTPSMIEYALSFITDEMSDFKAMKTYCAICNLNQVTFVK